MTNDVSRHFTVEETERGWIVWVKITTPSKRYRGPASSYAFASTEAAWRWIEEQFGPGLDTIQPADEDQGDEAT